MVLGGGSTRWDWVGDRGYHRLWDSRHGEGHRLSNSRNTAAGLRPAEAPDPWGEEEPSFRHAVAADPEPAHSQPAGEAWPTGH